MLLKNKSQIFFTMILIPFNYQFIYAHNINARGNLTSKEYALFGGIGIVILSFFLIVLVSLNRQLKIAKEKLNESRQRFLDVTDAAEEIVWEIGNDTKFNYVSKKAEKVIGYSQKELFSMSVYDILKEEDRERLKKDLERSIEKKEKIYKRRYTVYHKDDYEVLLQMSGIAIHDEDNKFKGFRGVSTDITREYYQEQKLYFLARSDALTGIMNRRAFMEKAKLAFEKSLKEEKDFSFAMIDIDFFKKINDEHGHDAGDSVLKGLADLMKEFTGKEYLLGRLGGEEFAYAFPNADIKKAKEIITNLKERINKYIFIRNDKNINITISAGLSYSTKEDKSLSEICKRADIALYKAKNSGRNKIEM